MKKQGQKNLESRTTDQANLSRGQDGEMETVGSETLWKENHAQAGEFLWFNGGL